MTLNYWHQQLSAYLPNLSIKYPKKAPNITFIVSIGIKIVGSFHPIINARGANRINDIITPFSAPLIFKFVLEMKKPATIQNIIAEKLASQVRF